MSLPWIILLVAIVAIILGIAGYHQGKRRRASMRQIAESSGLNYHPNSDYLVGQRFPFLDPMHRGENRYVAHQLEGRIDGHEVLAFDYHFQRDTRDSRGMKNSRRFSGSYRIIALQQRFPRLMIDPEGWIDKFGEAFGSEDIDFDSHEFSRTFRVRSASKKFAYDICHVRMMDYLLQHPDLEIQIEEQTLALHSSRRLKPDRLEFELQRLLQIRQLMPDYLFTET